MLQITSNSLQLKGGVTASRECPRCHSEKNWKDGQRSTKTGKKQRYKCQDCGYRFTESPILSTNLSNNGGCQVCAFLTEAKNLSKVEPLKLRLAGATAEIKSKVFEHLWHLKKQGYKDSTIRLRSYLLTNLVKRGANLLDPESVKEIIAQVKGTSGYKLQFVSAYDSFVFTSQLTWNPPNYKQIKKLPFIPLESELDTLIVAAGFKGAIFLQILKETGMRKGEAGALRWKDIDTERKTISVNQPEKNSNARTIKVSTKLIKMLKQLPAHSEKVFNQSEICYINRNFFEKRKQLAKKFQNPRLLRISFHTFRHWKATMEYHKTKDILHVKQLLGHRNINSTLIYTQLVNFESDEYHVRTARTLKEACELAEAGFQYFTTIENAQVFRKRK